MTKTLIKLQISLKLIGNKSVTGSKTKERFVKQKRKSKAARTGSVRFPLMEDQLNEEFLAMRRDGKSETLVVYHKNKTNLKAAAS